MTLRRAAGRPRHEGAARAAIVSTADRLFYERGIDGVSVDEIARTAGVTRRTLYYHFEGKDGLVMEHVRLRDRAIKQSAERATLLDAFVALERLFCQRDYRGCAITNVVFSGHHAPAVVGRTALRHKREMQRWFVDEARKLGAKHPDLVGRQVMLLYEGASVAARTLRDRDIPKAARNAAEILLREDGATV